MNLPKFKSVLCLNGRIPQREFFEHYSHLPIICADGAVKHLINLELTPDLLIGDLDSAEIANVHNGTEIIKISCQNDTDFDKCLNALEQRNLLPCLIVGMSGGELDHILYNINVFMKSAKKYSNCFFDCDEGGINKWGFALNSGNSITLKGQSKNIISILPFPNVCISTSGLSWDLERAELKQLSSCSVRNKVEKQEAYIVAHSGQALILMDSDELR